MKGQPTKAAAAYIFGLSQPTWPLEAVLVYLADDFGWRATTRYSPDGVLLLASGVDEAGRRAIRIETLASDAPIAFAFSPSA